MGFIDWHYKYSKKFSMTSMKWIVFGKLLGILALGAYFSRNLVTYGYQILLVGALITAHYLWRGFQTAIKKKAAGWGDMMYGYIGGALILLFLGIQSPQLPYAIWLFWIGVGIAIVGWITGKK